MLREKSVSKLVWLCLIGLGLAACGGPGDTSSPEIPATEAIELEDGSGVVVTEEIEPATEEVVVETEEVSVTNTSPPVPETFATTVEDDANDCATPSGQPVECAGIDISKIIVATVNNADELNTFNQEAGEEGFVLADMTITYDFPVIVLGVIVLEFDPEAGFFCINWGDQTPEVVPQEPEENVVATCINPLYEFIYVNTIDFSGDPDVESDPNGTRVIFTPDQGITYVQATERIFLPERPDRITVLAVANDSSQHDQLSFDPNPVIENFEFDFSEGD